MNKKKAIVLDIDDCTSDFIGNLLKAQNNIYGTKYTREDFQNWQMPDDIRETFIEYEYELYISQPILPKVKRKLKELKRLGYCIIFMTARDESFRRATVFNLALNGIKYDGLFFNKNKSLKMNRLLDRYDIVAFADDKMETINRVAKHTSIPNVYLITRSYNRLLQEDKRVKRIFSLDDIKLQEVKNED